MYWPAKGYSTLTHENIGSRFHNTSFSSELKNGPIKLECYITLARSQSHKTFLVYIYLHFFVS
jgi:hypothetical protein